MIGYKKPLPVIHEKNREFWEGCKRHELLIQRCRDCGTYRFPPRSLCHQCQSAKTEWVRSSGRGTIHSFTVLHHSKIYPIHPEFIDEAPYAVILVELADVGGLHIVSNIVDCQPEDIKIGMPVEVIFDDVTKEITLPKFKRVT
jgi:uncharacterized OB-fold protein